MQSSSGPGAEGETKLAEMVRQAERLIHHQVKAQEELDDKSQQAVTFAVAALGGGPALGFLYVLAHAL